MTDILQQSIRWLAEQCEAYLAHEVEYQRGTDSVVVSAAIGRTVFEETDEYGVVTQYEARDFLIRVASLRLNGQQIEPARGDRIVETDETGTHVYEVMAPRGEAPWRYSDPYRQLYCVHTQEVT